MNTEEVGTSENIDAEVAKFMSGLQSYNKKVYGSEQSGEKAEGEASNNIANVTPPSWYANEISEKANPQDTIAKITSWALQLAAQPKVIREKVYKVNKTSHNILLDLAVWYADVYEENDVVFENDAAREKIITTYFYPKLVEQYILVRNKVSKKK